MFKLPEAAARLGVSIDTARRYVRRGEIPSAFIGGAYRISEADLEEFVESRRSRSPKVEAPDGSGLADSKETVLVRSLRETVVEEAEQWEKLVFSNWRFSPTYSEPTTAVVVREFVRQRVERAEEKYSEIRPFLSEAEREAFGPVMDRLTEAYDHIGRRAKEILEVERGRAEKRGEEKVVAELRRQIDLFEVCPPNERDA